MTSAADFEFILTTVLGQKVDSPIHKLLNRAGIDDGTGITYLAERCIANLKYKDGTSETAVLEGLQPEGYQQLLRCFKAYIQRTLDVGIMVHKDWQNLVTKDEFQEFRSTVGYDPDIATRTDSDSFGSNIKWSYLVQLVAALHSPNHEILFSNSRKVSNVTRHPSLCHERQQAMGLCSSNIEGPDQPPPGCR